MSTPPTLQMYGTLYLYTPYRMGWAWGKFFYPVMRVHTVWALF